jgi:hypothetical protein
MNASSDTIACEVLNVAPVIMRTIRAEMRSRRTPELSVVQFEVGFSCREDYQIGKICCHEAPGKISI